MALAMTAAAHRERPVDLLNESYSKGVASPARSVILAEAQVHATLALSAPAEEKKAPARRKAAPKAAAPAAQEVAE